MVTAAAISSFAFLAQVAEELTAVDVIRAHARDELGIDIDDLANPMQVCVCACMRVHG